VEDLPTVVAWDERCLAHENGSMLLAKEAAKWLDVPHVERPERLSWTISVLEDAGVLHQLRRLESRHGTRAELELVHQPAMIDMIEEACAKGKLAWVGPEARVGTDSWEPALNAVGTVLEITDSVLEGSAANGLALIRPPGHHATATEPMGFCLFNNVAIAARHAPQLRGLGRIAILDWDVHHGNGTESIFYEDPSVLYISMHQEDLYPRGRGAATDRGRAAGLGSTVNIPLPAGTGDAGYMHAYNEIVAPALQTFEPELLFISAGQDAAASDPLGRMSVTTEGFRALTHKALDTARAVCGGRVVVALEGGYSLAHLPFCNLAIAEALARLEPTFPTDPLELDVPTELRDFEREAVESNPGWR
jgi:acetoin utilization deacetylase AcuC-like enzyme